MNQNPNPHPNQRPNRNRLPPHIDCPVCFRRSFNPNDVREQYCGFCHAFHADLVAGSPARASEARRAGDKPDTMQAFPPLTRDHPVVGKEECKLCHRQFRVGDVTTLIPEKPPAVGSLTPLSVLCHAHCVEQAIDYARRHGIPAS